MTGFVKFLVLMAEEDSWERWEALSDADQQAIFDRFTAFTEAVQRPRLGGSPARLSIALTGLARSGQQATAPGRPVTEGPFAETIEQMGGFWLVDLPDLDAAVEAARLLPDAYSVEVRTGHRHGRLSRDGCTVPTVEEVWRDEWGRLLALLVAQVPAARPGRGRAGRRV